MFLSKNIKKTRKKPALLRKKHLQQPLLTKEQKKLPRCRFKEIPPPNKFVNEAPIYVINGDILFMEYNGMLVTELSLFNQFKLCQEVIVEHVAGQKSVLIKLIQKADIDKNVPKWTNLVDRLRKVDNHYTKQWIKTITDFTHTYNKVMQRQSRKKLKSESRKKFFSQVTSQTDHQRETLFKQYPCLQLKFRIKRHHNYLTEVLFTESLVKLLGQSVESFVLTVLHEGLPQIMPFDNPLVNSLIKPLIENYFTIDDQGYRIPEHNTTLLIKNHYARDVKYQAHLFMNYETNTFGLDIIIAILNAGEPYILQDHEFKQINPYFLGSVAKKEIEFCTFLWKYYGLKNLRESLYDDRRCLIRGLDESDDEEIEVKKCEDEG